MRRLSAALLLAALAPAACTDPGPPWKPGTVYPTPIAPNARGLLDRRGLIHAHSVHSHDACDGHPLVEGQPDQACFDDFRRDLCTVQHDFVFLTDHRDSFDSTEFPDTLLHRADRGDLLIERGGVPLANRAACPGGRGALILAGAEAGTMPVGLEGHVADRADRGRIYGRHDDEAIARLKAKGAVVLVAHTEGWRVDDLATMPIDGFEMYNLHANTFLAAPQVLLLLNRLAENRPGLPDPNLVMLSIFSEDPRYLTAWGTVLSRGLRRVTTMGTDCHRNTFPDLMSDGERVDSYRRMMLWFSNHLLVTPENDGSFDDRHLKAALRGGRLYGAFEVLGYPEGFDFHATVRATTIELGGEVALGAAPELRVTMPKVAHLDPARTPPTLEIRILRAIEGGWEQVATGTGDVSFKPAKPGAYRAEVRIVPEHLREDLGLDADDLLSHDYVWIYSNPIYVR